jgi:hypothetical protein
MNISNTVIPKSDQTNADDLIAGPKTITITSVKAGSSNEQPIDIHYEGNPGRPYKPCKSMRRVLIHIWGDDASVYVGRRLTLIRDPNVKFGGDEVGGIRISHASHIDAPAMIALTVTRGKRKPYRVDPLVETKQAATADELLDRDALLDIGRSKASGGLASLQNWWTKELTASQRKAIGQSCPQELKDIAEAVK